MTTLHIVRQSAFNTNDLHQCLQVSRSQDTIVLIDDGCYNLHHKLLIDIEKDKSIKINVVLEHAKARAIKVNETRCSIITMSDLVSLTFENKRVITWQ